MRIDEINLLGQFKITGNTGNNSQAIGMSGGSTSFIDVVASGGGSSEGLVKRSGYNYVIVEATDGDAISNGAKLKTAYIEAVTLLGQIGTPAADNRVSILLTPGDYNLDLQLSVDVSFIDLVGISQNPLDTIVRASGSDQTIGFVNPGLDFGLYNIDLRSGGTGTQVAFWDGGSNDITYLRMKNVVISGNGFFDSGTSFYSFYDLDGDFEDITVLDGCYFAMASNSLTGTFKNIKIGDVPNAFYTLGSLTGTYKNITISNTANGLISAVSISGIFEDIKVNSDTGATGFRGSLSGYFKNIILTGSYADVFIGTITGSFEDIEISTFTSAFSGDGNDIDGVFKNIKIGDSTGPSFVGDNVYGTYSNIEIGNAPGFSAFQSTSSLSASFKDITLGNVGIAFQSGANITGTYENITMGDVGGDCFVSTTDIIGTFKNIKVGNVGTSLFIPTNDLNGTYENITVGDVTSYAFYAPNSISGTYKNISVKSVSDNFFLTDTSTINGIFDQIYIGNSGNYTFYSGSTLTGTFSNIEILNCGRSFGPDITGYYDGITIGISSNLTFVGISTGTYRNIKVGSCTSFFTSTSNIQPTLVENIEVGVVSSLGNFISSSSGSLDGIYKNVKVGSVGGDAFSVSAGISGTYSNIEVGSCDGNVFYTTGGTDINANVDKMTVGTASYLFYAPSGQVTVNTKINKLTANANLFAYSDGGSKLFGKLTNSTIDMTRFTESILLSGGIIERCKILLNGGNISDAGFGGNVIYTMTNTSIVITAGIESQNIEDASITS